MLGEKVDDLGTGKVSRGTENYKLHDTARNYSICLCCIYRPSIINDSKETYLNI